MDPIWAVGLMTGTVLDGNIDVALLQTDGERIERFGAYRLAPYPQWIRTLLEETLSQARKWNFRGPEPAIFGEAEAALTDAQSSAVRELVESAGLSLKAIGVVGFHGQSVLHRAPQPGRLGATRQLGDGERMHALLGVRVAYDFRSADVMAGGQGAPLAAIYHQALLRMLGAKGETAVLNLGGVANITWWDGGQSLIAFDAGPANAPINDFVKGLGLGHNALAALITRGLAELTRLACAAGGRRETLAGLSGLGDLVLTCTGNLSRNRRVGIELASGRALPEILAGMKMVAEGVLTTGAALALGERYGVELPITTQMAEVLDGRADVRTALDALMLRPQRAEAETG